MTIGLPVRRARGALLRVFRGLGGIVFVVWGAATAGFLAVKAIPGDPVEVMLGVQARVGEDVKERIREEWGLNEPLFVQYIDYLGRLVRGDLGQSYQLRQPVLTVLGSQAAPTIVLGSFAILLALILALSSALLVRGRWGRRIVSLVELVLVSSPGFWIGLVLIAVFSFRLHWFPVAATQGFPALVLPAVTLALPIAGIVSQVLRQGLDAASGQPFALSARARGVDHGGLLLRHSLRHAAADSITLTGYILGAVLGGAVLVETVFGRPGLGRVTLRAIIDRDLPVVLGLIVLTALLFAVINLLVDLAYRAIDPRLRLTGGVV